MRYPAQPPIIEPAEHISAYLKAFFGMATESAIRSISGGIGKNEDSHRASINSAQLP